MFAPDRLDGTTAYAYNVGLSAAHWLNDFAVRYVQQPGHQSTTLLNNEESAQTTTSLLV